MRKAIICIIDTKNNNNNIIIASYNFLNSWITFRYACYFQYVKQFNLCSLTLKSGFNKVATNSDKVRLCVHICVSLPEAFSASLNI